MRPIITLTTDFGSSDGYVAAMKGTILRICPTARLVDITHHITAYDVMEAAFVLRQATPHYPAGTIHLVVVDPGVGSQRRPVALRYGSHYLVGPDNGLFTLLLDNADPEELVVLNRPRTYCSAQLSTTFHGRDIFAPVAALLASGQPFDTLGSRADTLRPLRWALPIDDDQGIRGWIVHVDRFGNCITNIPHDLFVRRRGSRGVKCYVGNTIIKGVSRTYCDVEPGEPLLVFGSGNHLEVSVNRGNAAELLHIRRGTPVSVVFVDERQDTGSSIRNVVP